MSTQEDVNVGEMLEALQGFTEAPASLNFYGVTQRGWNIQVTLRDADEFNLLKRFGKLLAALEEQFKVAPKPVGQQPAPLPETHAQNGEEKLPATKGKKTAQVTDEAKAGNEETKVITVEKVKKVINENGKTFIKVFGSPYNTWGVTAWPEVVGELFDIDEMKVGKEYEYEGTATVLLVDGKAKKIISFN